LKATYPNEKIYFDKDLIGSSNYFGHANNKLIRRDFGSEQIRAFAVRTEIVWGSETSTDTQVNQQEVILLDITNKIMYLQAASTGRDLKNNC
jgi:hypothetical protein